MLSARIEPLCHQLLSAGRRNGRYWQVGGVDNSKGASMWVHLSGARRGNWQDAATGEFGDTLDLVAACRYGGNLKDAYAWASDWLGIGQPGQVPRPVAPQEQAPPSNPTPDDEVRRRVALAMWLRGTSIADTPVDLYLRGRSIDLRELGRQPASLRYHPALYHAESRARYPAMVAAISNQDGQHVATHRTWLAQSADGLWRKAPIANPKMTYGTFAGGAIRLWRGASRKRLTEAPADQPVVLCEGIETALSAVLAMPELRVLCGVSLGNLGAVWLPPQIRMVVLCPEADDKPAARAAFQRVVHRHLDAGREVRLARPGRGKDWNDVLQDAGAA